MVIKINWIINSILLVSQSGAPQQTADDYLSEIRAKDFRIISRESREEAQKVFELDATDLVTNEHFTLNDTFMFYSQFSSICGKPFIEKADTVIKMRGNQLFGY